MPEKDSQHHMVDRVVDLVVDPVVDPVVDLVVDLGEVDLTWTALVGGKGARLGELTRIEGAQVPRGFCVTTAAFRRFTAAAGIEELLDGLTRVPAEDPAAAAALAARIRETLDACPIPQDVQAAITRALGEQDEDVAHAVRSSATAEDLPTASFAGLHESFLDVVGPDAILERVRRCWSSLFTERAVAYRRHRGLDHRGVAMAVVVQQLVRARAAGVLFTADPVTSHRRVARVESVPGPGEALVSGRLDPDVHTVRDGADGVRVVATRALRHDPPVLTDDQVLRLDRLGRRIEAHFAAPQDIEWCLADVPDGEDDVRIVQSRPITTLFPVPRTGGSGFRVYLSVGHQQMMTDPMTPLGMSFWQLTTPAPMAEAGGRLFVDVTDRLTSPAGRDALLALVGRSDPLTGDALSSLLQRDDLAWPPPAESAPPPPVAGGGPAEIEVDPAIVTELIEGTQASIAAAERALQGKSGIDLLDAIRTDLVELRRVLFDPRSHQVFSSAMEAVWWLADHLERWLGERGAADLLTRSVPHNITAQMGLELLDVADVIRPHPDVVAFLRGVARRGEDDFLEDLARIEARIEGGRRTREAIEGWLVRYGMRCAGEIDLARPRWSEQPSALLPVILGHVDHAEPGEGARRFERGLQQARATEREVLGRLAALPDGARKVEQTAARITRVRTYMGYREYPKYGMVSRYFVYKRALTSEADRLVRAGVLRDREDLFFLRFEELTDLVRSGRVDRDLLDRRRRDHQENLALRPPRVLTSDGEALTGSYRRQDQVADALVGLPVSVGVVEGRARVVLDPARAQVEPGDILVTVHTDPSWTPLFVAIAGLVTEVGGSMTHGAVIAREYGLPAVVGVVDATRLIRDGQRIRVHGSDGHVEILR